jgi:death-on-curing protein
MRSLSLDQILRLHARIIETSGGGTGLRDLGRLQSALAQPLASYDGNDLYPDLVSKTAALAFSLVQGHPFVDGNKRIGHASMEMTLLVNGYEIVAEVDDQERMMLGVASGEVGQDSFTEWVRLVARLRNQ